MWLTWILPSIAVATVVILVVAFYQRREEPRARALPSGYANRTMPTQGRGIASPKGLSDQPGKPVLSEVIKSLAPTLLDDERRVMDELVKAGGEVLQSDLPRLTDFSKATVSKAIHGLETRGIVLREKHKWTYWCKINPRLIERAFQEQAELEEPRAVTA